MVQVCNTAQAYGISPVILWLHTRIKRRLAVIHGSQAQDNRQQRGNTIMKNIRISGTCALTLLLAMSAPVWAQEKHEQEQREIPARQEEKQAKPEKSARPEAKPAARAEKPATRAEKQVVRQDKPAMKDEKPAKETEKNTKQTQMTQQEMQSKDEKKNNMRPGGQVRGNRIPDDRYRAKFGEQHRFHVSQNDYRQNHRFNYGGYSFQFIGLWPSDWLYTQDVYVVEIDGVYYLCNPNYPGVNIEISVIL